jgi:hypothetical protein
MPRVIFLCLTGLFLLAGCVRFSVSTPLAAQTESQPSEIPPQATATPAYPWTDENMVMSGICFEAAQDAAGQVFILRDADAQSHFYDEADNSHLCRHPVMRYPFDFSGGRILVGLWSKGNGCRARYDVLGVVRDDAAQKLTIQLHFVTEGTCDYELVRPFWIGLEGVAGYDIALMVAG